MSDITWAGITVDDEDDAEVGLGVAAVIGWGVAGDEKLIGVMLMRMMIKLGWVETNDDNVKVEVVTDSDYTFKGVSEDEKWTA